MIEGIILKIQDGKIKEITTGTCKGKGTVMCENIVILVTLPLLIGHCELEFSIRVTFASCFVTSSNKNPDGLSDH
jgi:hypothetical protein